MMVPGTASPETVIWAAKHRYPYIVLGSFLEQTQELIQIYRETAEEVGYEMQPENIGYLIRCFVSDTEEHAQEQGKNFFWQNGALNKQPREWMAPPGYATVDVAGIRRLRAVSRAFDSLAYEEAQKNYQVVIGTPDQVIEKLRYVRDLLGVGHMCLWSQDGYMTHQGHGAQHRVVRQRGPAGPARCVMTAWPSVEGRGASIGTQTIRATPR